MSNFILLYKKKVRIGKSKTQTAAEPKKHVGETACVFHSVLPQYLYQFHNCQAQLQLTEFYSVPVTFVADTFLLMTKDFNETGSD